VVGAKIERGVLRRHIKLNGDAQTYPNVEGLKLLFPSLSFNPGGVLHGGAPDQRGIGGGGISTSAGRRAGVPSCHVPAYTSHLHVECGKVVVLCRVGEFE
jgi:hypothetical protein